MIVYRICQTYPPDHNPIDGQGSFNHGARWNSKGRYAVYTSSSLALARAELARHIHLDNIPDGFRVYEIQIPDALCLALSPLPMHWQKDLDQSSSQKAGDQLLANNQILGFTVPSKCDPDSKNYILNPLSVHYMKVKVTKSYPFIP